MASTSTVPGSGRTSRSPRKKAGTGPSAGNADVYTMAEAARLKGVSYHTVSRAVRRGKLPAQRLGRMALISVDDLRDWRPMRERAPRKYRRREPDPAATPALLDLASGERVSLAQRLSTLYEVIHGAAGELPKADFLDLLVDRLASALDFRRVAIWELDEASGTTKRSATFGPKMSSVEAAPLADAPIFRRALESGQPVQVVNLSELGYADPEVVNNVSDIFVAPLRAGQRILGFVVADCNGERFTLTPDQTVLAEGLANQTALALDRTRLREEQARRADQLAAIIENVAEAVFAVDAAGNLTVMNAAGRDLYGVEERELPIRDGLTRAVDIVTRREPSGDVIKPEDTPILRAIAGEALRDRRYVITRRDGTDVPVSVNAQPIRNAQGDITGAVAIVRRVGEGAAPAR